MTLTPRRIVLAVRIWTDLSFGIDVQRTASSPVGTFLTWRYLPWCCSDLTDPCFPPCSNPTSLHVVHVAASSIPEGSKLNVAQTGVENTIELKVDVPEFSEAISVLNLIGDIYFFSGLSLSHARGLLEVGCGLERVFQMRV